MGEGGGAEKKGGEGKVGKEVTRVFFEKLLLLLGFWFPVFPSFPAPSFRFPVFSFLASRFFCLEALEGVAAAFRASRFVGAAAARRSVGSRSYFRGIFACDLEVGDDMGFESQVPRPAAAGGPSA